MKGFVPWLLVALALLGGALALSAQPTAAWDWQPALAHAQPWRSWTGAWVHWTPMHLAMNVGGLAALCALAWRTQVLPRDALAWALAWPLTQAALALQPALRHYGGLSGVLHAGAAIVAWRLLHQGPGRPRRIGLLLAAGLVLKLLWEAPWQAATRALPGWDFAVAPLAHSTGAIAGLVCALLLERAAHRRALTRARRAAEGRP